MEEKYFRKHLPDLDGNILKSFNPNNLLKDPTGICVLDDPNEEKIFIGDMINIIKYIFLIQSLSLNFNLVIKIIYKI